MGCFHKTLSCITIVVIIQTLALAAQSAETIDPPEFRPVQGHCTTDDLNHSVLVECDESSCKDAANSVAIWPADGREVIHMYSTRAGERFVVDKLPNLDYQEHEDTRFFDINNTLYVEDLGIPKLGTIRFGTTINTKKLLAQMGDNSFGSNYGIIMRDLFGLPPYGNGFTILRLPITRDILLDVNDDIFNLIAKIDSWALEVDPKTKIRIILSLEEIEDGSGLYESLIELLETFKLCTTCWVVAINEVTEFRRDDLQLVDLKSLIKTNNLFGAANLNDIKQNPNLVHYNTGTSGILVRTEFSTNYKILDDIGSFYGQHMLTIGGYRQQVVEFGDWQNARNYAVMILNHLNHGSDGFIEEMSNLDIMAESKGQDGSIYNLRPDHKVHYRGPMYYAIGHFSRHLTEGSELLETNVTTAANMFAAHYGAFRVRDKVVVAIVLNDNEHLLPFRLAVDGKIKAFTNIKPKSFNTFVIDENIK